MRQLQTQGSQRNGHHMRLLGSLFMPHQIISYNESLGSQHTYVYALTRAHPHPFAVLLH